MIRTLFFTISICLLTIFNTQSKAQSWDEIIKAVASDRAADDLFGYSVSISGDYAIVGAHHNDKDASGGNTLTNSDASYIFEKGESGNWLEKQKIVASDRTANDWFGAQVSVSGDYAIVGAYGNDTDASGENTLDNAGAAYIFCKFPIVTASADDTIVCEGENVTLTASGDADSYTWDNSVNDGVAFTPPVGTTTYTVTGTNLTGCYAIDTIDIKVNLTYSFIETQTICDGEAYNWHGQDLDTSGTYYDNQTTVNGCDSIYKLTLTVNPTPSNFIITGLTSVSESQFEIYYVPINTDLTYSWNTENGNVISYPSDNSAQIQWGSLGTGYIYVMSTNQFGCSSDTAKLEINIVSTDTNNINNNDDINIYPNPAKGKVFVKCADDFVMEIYNLSGKKLITSEKNRN